MKLTELLVDQSTIIQLIWGEQKIEFYSMVMDKDENTLYMSPYIHQGKELDISITQETKGVVCNLFADDLTNGQRISWRNLELKTVKRNNKTVYSLRAYSFNTESKHDDRRTHDRIIIQKKGIVHEVGTENEFEALIHDISDIGVSFYAPTSYKPSSQQVVISFKDIIDGEDFHVKVNCTIARVSARSGNQLVGCKTMGENKDYLLYAFLKRIKEKSKNGV